MISFVETGNILDLSLLSLPLLIHIIHIHIILLNTSYVATGNVLDLDPTLASGWVEIEETAIETETGTETGTEIGTGIGIAIGIGVTEIEGPGTGIVIEVIGIGIEIVTESGMRTVVRVIVMSSVAPVSG